MHGVLQSFKPTIQPAKTRSYPIKLSRLYCRGLNTYYNVPCANNTNNRERECEK